MWLWRIFFDSVVCSVVCKEIVMRVENTKILYFKKGQTIIEEGDTSREAYIVNSGKVTVVKNDEIIATLGENEIFGEMGWLQHIPRSATVMAVEDVSLRVIKEEDALLFMEHNPQALIPILKVVCSRMGEMLDRMSKNT